MTIHEQAKRNQIIQAMKDNLRLHWVLVGGGDEDLEKVHVTDESLEHCADAILALVGVQRPEDVARAICVALYPYSWDRCCNFNPKREKCNNGIRWRQMLIAANAVLALPHTGQPVEGWFLPRSALNELQIATLEHFLSHAKRAHEIDCKIRKDGKETLYELDSLKHLSAAPASPRAEGEWQPIETAPKDGTTIFGRNIKMGQRGLVHFNGHEWEMVNGLTNYPMGVGFYPTHWMPEPVAPEYVFGLTDPAPPAIIAEKQTETK